MSDVQAILLFLLYAILFLLIVQYALRIVLNYRLGKAGIFINLFFLLPIFYISYSNIKSVHITDSTRAMFEFKGIRFNFLNRVWGKQLIIERKRSLLIKEWAITPGNPAEFVKVLEENMQKCQGHASTSDIS